MWRNRLGKDAIAMNYKLSNNAKAIAAKLAASRAAYANMYKPKTWCEFVNNKANNYILTPLLAEIIRRANILDKENTVEDICSAVEHVDCAMDQKLNTNSWSYDYAKDILYFSRDLWEGKDTEEYEYQVNAAIASVLAYYLHKETHRGFYWRLCFYALGFNPLRDLEERKAIEAKATEILAQAELPTLKQQPTALKLGVKPNGQ